MSRVPLQQRSTALVLALLLGSSVLAGCGGDDAEEPGPGEPTATASETEDDGGGYGY